MTPDRIAWITFVVVGAAVLVYVSLLVLRRAPFRRWPYDAAIVSSAMLAAAAAITEGSWFLPHVMTWVMTIGWFATVLPTLALPRRLGFSVREGDALPSFTVVTTAGAPFTREAIMSAAPALLVVYRGHW
jgi:hypothetical protein